MMLSKYDPESVNECVKALNAGKVIIIPTDTVYGFSALAEKCLNTDEKIRKIKGRSEIKPFIQLIGNPQEIKKYTNDVIPENILKLWPGPLTVIVHDKTGSGTTAFRCPDEPWLCQILNQINYPVYSTSANRSGYPVLNSPEELNKEFQNEVELIIDGGLFSDTLPSTIIAIENGTVKVIRQGELKLE